MRPKLLLARRLMLLNCGNIMSTKETDSLDSEHNYVNFCMFLVI